MLRRFSILCLIAVMSCAHCNTHNAIDSGKIDLVDDHYSKETVVKALEIVIEELSKQKVYSMAEMYSVINGFKQRSKLGTAFPHPLVIEIVDGVPHKDATKKTTCIYVTSEKFEGQCLAGYFDGWYSIQILYQDKLHKTALAHEMLHYFKKHLDKEYRSGHEPKEQWEKLVGYKKKGSIGIINEALKKHNL